MATLSTEESNTVKKDPRQQAARINPRRGPGLPVTSGDWTLEVLILMNLLILVDSPALTTQYASASIASSRSLELHRSAGRKAAIRTITVWALRPLCTRRRDLPPCRRAGSSPR